MKSFIGMRYYNIKVTSIINRTQVEFLCNCGNTGITNRFNLRKSCKECRRKESRERHLVHGYRKSSFGKPKPELNSWNAMQQRCKSPSSLAFKNYGGRGITVCERWLGPNGFINFLEDMGEKPEPKHLYSLDRIDNNGNYTPDNCHWTTRSEQRINRRQYTLKHPIKTIVCHTCHKEFQGHCLRKYCTKKCRVKAQYKQSVYASKQALHEWTCPDPE